MTSTIYFDNVQYSIRSGFTRVSKKILHGVSGRFPSGSFVGILGPSGSGKTSLLNILSGTIKNYQGNVHIQHEVHKKQFGTNNLHYIQQDTYLCDLLTVRETFEFAADLKIPQVKSRQEKINNTIENFGLQNVLDTSVGCISGGERKRVSIGIELLSDFSVMLLDEPTTGLDSTSSKMCIDNLKSLSVNNGKTIICTIHQPTASILAKFDYLYVMTDGYCLYEGSPRGMLDVLGEYQMDCPYFHNPADYKIAYGEYGRDDASIRSRLIERFHRSQNKIETKRSDCKRNSEYTVGNYRQFKTLLRREYIKAKRHPSLTYLRLISSVIATFVMCTLFWRVGSDASKTLFNYNGICAYIMLLILPSIFITLLIFPTEYQVLRRESINRWYSVIWYYVAITLTELPINLIYCLNSTMIFYYCTDQARELWRFATVFLLSGLVSMVAQSLGLLIGAIFKILEGTIIGAGLTCIFMAVGGYGITFTDISPSIKWLENISYMKFAVHGMTSTLMGYQRPLLLCPENVDYCHFKDSQKMLDLIGVESNLIRDICALIGFLISFRVLVYLTLRHRISN